MIVFGICWVQLLGIIFLTANFKALSFRLNRPSHSNGRASQILMGKRSLEDQKLSKKQMFRKLRNHLEERAKVPGFFEDEKPKPDIELFCKSNKDGRQISDCPYTQFIQLILLRKNIPYERTLVHPDATEVERLNSQHISNLPILIHRDLILSDPFLMAEHLEKSFPFNSLTRQGVYSYQDVIEKLINFFPTLTMYVTNNDATKEIELQNNFELQLNLIEDILRSTPGKYLCGIELTLADLFIFPQIFHAIATMLHFKRTSIYTLGVEPSRPALEKYITCMIEMEEFNDKRAYYNIDRVVNCWKIRRGDISIAKK